MAHFARVENGIVTQVLVVNNSDCLGPDGKESEAVGAAFCQNLFGGDWVQTSYNGNIRKNYAGEGFTWDPARDAFIPPQPYPSWSLDEATCRWIAPVPYPTDGNLYFWDEGTQQWLLSS